MTSLELLIAGGYRPIASLKQADQLVRREIKLSRRRLCRGGRAASFDMLADIRPGNWVKLVSRNKDYSTLLWRLS